MIRISSTSSILDQFTLCEDFGANCTLVAVYGISVYKCEHFRANCTLVAVYGISVYR